MSKFVNVLSDIDSVFASAGWTALNIEAYPSNYPVLDSSTEFVKIEVLPLSPNIGYQRFGIQGLFIIQIYTSTNSSTKRLMEISDSLSTLLDNKTLPNGTKTETGFLQVLGQDSDNPNLFRGDFTVNYTYYN